jgi:hypothetical protein
MICAKIGRLSLVGIVWTFLLASLSTQVVAQAPDRADDKNTLLTRATRMAEVGEPWEQTYFWLSPTRALFITQDYRPAPVPAGDEKLAPAVTPSRFKALGITVPSGTINPLTALNEKFGALLVGDPVQVHFVDQQGKATANPETRYYPTHTDLSPDRNALLFWDRTNSQWVVAALTGIRSFNWPTEDNINWAYWLRDGRRWFEWRQSPYPTTRRSVLKKVVIHSLDDPKAAQEIQIEGAPNGSPLGVTDKGNPLVMVAQSCPGSPE